jgi:hypothetical protein
MSMPMIMSDLAIVAADILLPPCMLLRTLDRRLL